MTKTIAISRKGGITDEIDADVIGDFAIHETIPVSLGGWTLTHVPTGRRCLSTARVATARAARAKMLAAGLDWSFTDRNRMTDAHRLIGRWILQKYEGR